MAAPEDVKGSDGLGSVSDGECPLLAVAVVSEEVAFHVGAELVPRVGHFPFGPGLQGWLWPFPFVVTMLFISAARLFAGISVVRVPRLSP